MVSWRVMMNTTKSIIVIEKNYKDKTKFVFTSTVFKEPNFIVSPVKSTDIHYQLLKKNFSSHSKRLLSLFINFYCRALSLEKFLCPGNYIIRNYTKKAVLNHLMKTQ